MSDRFPEAPEGKQINPFTGEIEDAAPITLSASPADQRILAAPPHTDPLPDLIERAVNARDDGGIDVENHVGPSLTEDPLPGETPLAIDTVQETPNVDISAHLNEETTGGDAGAEPPNDKLLDDPDVDTKIGVEADDSGYAGLDTKAYNESLEAREEAEKEDHELPPIEPPVPGDQVGNDVADESAPVEEEEAPAEDEVPVEEEPAPTKADLLEEARELDIEGRSSMSKDELAQAVDEARTEEGE